RKSEGRVAASHGRVVGKVMDEVEIEDEAIARPDGNRELRGRVGELVVESETGELRLRRPIGIIGIENDLAREEERVALLHEGRMRRIGVALLVAEIDETGVGELALDSSELVVGTREQEFEIGLLPTPAQLVSPQPLLMVAQLGGAVVRKVRADIFERVQT